jgi:ankyrin repeat protein
LLAGGANVHQVDNEGHSVLRFALRGKDLACVQAILDAGADPCNSSHDTSDGRVVSDTTFSLHCDFDIAQAVHRVSNAFMINQAVNDPHFEHAGDLPLWIGEDGKTPVDTLDRHGKTALMHACEHGYAECAKLLLEHKADPNFVGRDGRLPIHALATGKNPAMVKQMVDAGARLTARDGKGYTAIELAQSAGNTPMVVALTQALEEFTRSATSASDNVRAMKTLKFKARVQS